MKALHYLTLLSLLSTIEIFGVNADLLPTKNSVNFTENRGQVQDQFYRSRPDVLFGGSDSKMAFHIKKNGISYQLSKPLSYNEVAGRKGEKAYRYADKMEIYRVDMSWENCDPNTRVVPGVKLLGTSNYVSEAHPAGINNVPSYKDVWLNNIYKGVNVHYYESHGELKCDYVVAPQTNYKAIQIKITGAEIALKKNGNLIFHTPLGDIEEGAPLAYQHGKRVPAKWIISGSTLSFEIGKYDVKSPLTIDPVTRVWGTYYGGTQADRSHHCAVDGLGNVYMTGITSSSGGTIIATVGSHQASFSSGTDAFLAKFDAAGTRLWATYYGAGSGENGISCAVDPSNNIYMAGDTWGTGTVLGTTGAHQPANGGGSDAFLVKFNSSGVRLWATYYGGAQSEWGQACATDLSGNVFLAGTTTSTNNIAFFGYDNNLTGLADAFLVKFNSAGVRQWGTYYGGINFEEGYGCSADISGNIYMSGYTDSPNNHTCCINPIASPGSFQYNKSTNDDAYLVKFDGTGSRLWGTFYGGGANEYGFVCSAYSNTAVYLGGYTESTTMAAGALSYQTSYGGGSSDGFFVKFNATGARQWASYYGGAGNDFVADICSDVSGNVYITGSTSSSVGIIMATPGSHQSTYGGGAGDAFIAKFSTTGPRQWGTYYGGAGDDDGIGLVSDNATALYNVGSTESGSSTVIATPAGHQASFGGAGSTDGYMAKFDVCIVSLTATSTGSALCAGNPATLTALGADSYSWLPGNSGSPTVAVTPTANLNYTLVGMALGCSNVTTNLNLIVNPLPTVSVNSGSICFGQSFTIAPSGASTYSYSGGSNTVSPGVTTNYTVLGTDTNGCVSTNNAVSTVSVVITNITVNSGGICPGQSFTMVPAGAATYTFSSGTAVVSPTTTTSYSVTGTSSLGCLSSNVAVSTVVYNPAPTISANSGSVCLGKNYTIQPSGANTYTITGGSFVVSPGVATSYSIVGTSAAGCAASNTVVVSVFVHTVFPTVTVAGGTVCNGTSFLLNPSGALSYTFSSGSPLVSPINTTNYTVTGANNVGCTSFAVATVTVYPIPTVSVSGPMFLCEGEEVVITASGANTYNWSNGSAGTSVTLSPLGLTGYTVIGTDANGCVKGAAFTLLVDPCTGLNTSLFTPLSALMVFPNPVLGSLSVSVIGTSHVTLMDGQGRIVLTRTIAAGTTEILMDKFANGIYLVKVESEGTTEIKKVVKID